MLKVDFDVLSEVSTAVHLNHKRIDDARGDFFLGIAFVFMGSFMIFETCFVTVEGTAALFAVVVDVYISFTEGTGYYNIGLSFLGQI